MSRPLSVQRISKRALAQDAKARAKSTTTDSFQNFAAKFGIGTDNLTSAGTYGFNPITRQRTILEWIHRGSWIGGVAVDVVADDMTKQGVEIRGDLEPRQIENLHRAATTWQIWNQINEVVKWSRLYGGALGVMMIDGQDPKTPYNPSRVGAGQFRGVMALDRWMVEPSLEDLVSEPGPFLGLPKYYRVIADAPALRRMTIHYSRCFRLEGIKLPYWQRLQENMWGISVFERLYDRMLAFDSATTGSAQLVYKSYIRTYKINKLREIIAAGGAAEAGLIKYVQMMTRFQSVEGTTLIDAEDDFQGQVHGAFGGLADCMLQFGQQISGALQIPMVRLFGQSPAGLNSTGESDLRTYYDGIRQQQQARLLVPVTDIYRALAASEGIRLNDSFSIEFKPLWIMNDVEKAQLMATIVQSIVQLDQAGITTKAFALKEIRQASRVTGVGTNVSDEEIQEAELAPPPGAAEAVALTQQQQSMQHADEDQALAAEQADKDDTRNTKDSADEIPQGSGLRARRDIQYKHPVSGRTNKIKSGSYHWVGNSSTSQRNNGVVEVVKHGHPMGSGVHMRHEQVREHFDVTDAATRDSVIVDNMLGDRKVMGFDVVVEHGAGEPRFGAMLPAAYGYLRNTDSAERGDQMDCFIGPKPEGTIYIIDSYRPEEGSFDEHKIMLGYASATAALSHFRSYYNGYGPERRVGIATEVKTDDLIRWVAIGDVTQPYYMPTDEHYVTTSRSKEHCAECSFYAQGLCSNPATQCDPKIPETYDGMKIVSAIGYCDEYAPALTHRAATL